jgi:hypothetical protein
MYRVNSHICQKNQLLQVNNYTWLFYINKTENHILDIRNLQWITKKFWNENESVLTYWLTKSDPILEPSSASSSISESIPLSPYKWNKLLKMCIKCQNELNITKSVIFKSDTCLKKRFIVVARLHFSITYI